MTLPVPPQREMIHTLESLVIVNVTAVPTMFIYCLNESALKRRLVEITSRLTLYGREIIKRSYASNDGLESEYVGPCWTWSCAIVAKSRLSFLFATGVNISFASISSATNENWVTLHQESTKSFVTD